MLGAGCGAEHVPPRTAADLRCHQHMVAAWKGGVKAGNGLDELSKGCRVSNAKEHHTFLYCLLYTSPSPRD
eukprot:3677935-Alexandrium_andersonii.AAC.1